MIDFTLEDISGKVWRLGDIRATIKILVVFSTQDCGRCLEDYRIYNAIVRNYPAELVAVLSISSDPTGLLSTFAVQKKLKYPILHDPGSIVESHLEIRTSPLLLLLGKTNRVLDV
jgi:peroxiredoxin